MTYVIHVHYVAVEKHCAALRRVTTHIAIQEALNGKSVDWMENGHRRTVRSVSPSRTGVTSNTERRSQKLQRIHESRSKLPSHQAGRSPLAALQPDENPERG